ncbi:hypothetical protein B0H13DRAFT_1876351 [Mycena leptocephala]|nr:hypothetical protein B0H13DRAFT_1876351 [Mycena leptocephala]
MVKLEPDAEGEAPLQRILDRDASVIPLFESDFLGYAPRATELDEELMSVDNAEAEEEVHAGDPDCRGVCGADGRGAADAAELTELRAVGSPELLEQKGLDKDDETHAKMPVHLEDAKERLRTLRKT